MSGSRAGLKALQEELRRFARERDWEQYHTPKNLVMALSGEIGELADLFQWLTPEESIGVTETELRDDVERELSDVFQYLLRLADVLGIDLEEATWRTIERNRGRFPPAPPETDGPPSKSDVDVLVAALSDSRGADRPADFPSNPSAADSPGMYSWWVSEEGRLMLSNWLEDELPPLIYAGQAGATRCPSGIPSSATLHSRIARNHIRGDARSSTFRRTISAILLDPLDLSVGEGGKLTPASRDRVSAWVNQYLKVKIAPFEDRSRLGRIETEVLIRLDPPLNLEGLPSTPLRRRLSDLRRQFQRM